MRRIEQDDLTEFKQQPTSWVKLILTSRSSYKESPAREETPNLKLKVFFRQKNNHFLCFLCFTVEISFFG
jgi:hypothetical protein